MQRLGNALQESRNHFVRNNHFSVDVEDGVSMFWIAAMIFRCEGRLKRNAVKDKSVKML